MPWQGVVLLVLTSAAISFGISVTVHYNPPGYAPSPAAVLSATNINTQSIEKVARVVAEMQRPTAAPEKVKK